MKIRCIILNIIGHKRMLLAFVIVLALPFTSFMPNYTEMLGLHVVVIDAGHGGKDPGCVGSASHEKDIALAIALKLGKAIEENYKDVKVIYTRNTDVFIPLHERAKIANTNKADLFICVHANASTSSATFGTETYVMGLHKTNANLGVAKRENASILMEDDYKTHYEGFDPNSDESYIAFSLVQSAHLDQSLSFASKIQERFKKMGLTDRGVKQAGFLVLYRTTMPSVLIETGFLSNSEDEKYLISEKNQDKMASSIFDAFQEYKKEVDSKTDFEEGKTKKKDKKEESDLEVLHAIGGTKYDLKKKREEKTTKKETVKDELVFKVQLTSSTKKIALIPQNFNGLGKLGSYFENGMHKYTIGNEHNIEAANELKETAKSVGYKDAFTVAFLNGKRIALDEALKMLQPKNNK